MLKYICLFIIGALIGYLFFTHSSAPHAGAENRLDEWINDTFDINASSSIRMSCCGWTVHVHHWIILGVCALGLYMYYGAKYSKVLYLGYGLCIGGMVHGLTYSDRFQIVFPTPDF